MGKALPNPLYCPKRRRGGYAGQLGVIPRKIAGYVKIGWQRSHPTIREAHTFHARCIKIISTAELTPTHPGGIWAQRYVPRFLDKLNCAPGEEANHRGVGAQTKGGPIGTCDWAPFPLSLPNPLAANPQPK